MRILLANWIEGLLYRLSLVVVWVLGLERLDSGD